MTRPTCVVVDGGGAYSGAQGLDYFEGISSRTAGARGLCMHRLEIPPGGAARPHLHERHETAIYVLSGRAGMDFGEGLRERLEVRAGQFLFIPAGVPHRPFNLSDEEPCTAVLARTDPDEQESVVPLDEQGRPLDTPEPVIRTATLQDAPAIAAVVREGLASYAEWAPEGWIPPTGDPVVWPVLRDGPRRGERCWVAAPAGGGAAVGVVTLGTTSRAIPSVAPGDVILRQLFVARSHWGSGVASALLEQALDAAREDGYATIWLATAAGAARARRFYARAGFTDRGGHLDPALGLEVITAARRLDGVAPAGA